MCKPKIKVPDTSAQQAEAERQRQIESQKAEEQRAQQTALIQQQLSQQQAEASRQNAANQAIVAAQQAEARRREQEAALRAKNMQEYATGRTQRVNDITNEINTAYQGFDDNYYNQFSKDFVDYYNPQIDQQYKDAVEKTTFTFGNQGGVDSSAAAKRLARILEAKRSKEAEIARNSVAASQNFRKDIDSQRLGLVSEATSAANIGPEVLPEGINDVGGQLAQISGKLAPYKTTAAQRAAGVKRPANAALGDVFGEFLPGSSGGGGVSTSGTSDFNADGIYSPSLRQTARIIN